nr:MAG: internal scaffolding protein [Microvirus sp.]
MKTSETKPRARKRVQVKFTKPTLTKQSFKDECNINNIVNRFQSTGQLPTNLNQDPQYGFCPEIDFKEALDLTKNLQAEFDALSSDDKAGFDNNFQNYGAFLQEYSERPESFYNIPEIKTDTNVSKTTPDTKEAPSTKTE